MVLCVSVVNTRKHRSTRMVKVGLSGMLATVLDVSALIALVEFFGVYVTIAAFVSAISGASANFLVNKFWAFEDHSAIDAKQVISYALVALTTAFLVAGAVHVFAVVIGWPYLAAKALAAILVFLAWGYPAQAKFVFPQPAS